MSDGPLNKWLFTRLALIGLNAIPILLPKPIEEKTFSVAELAMVFAFCAISLPFMSFMLERASRLKTQRRIAPILWSRPSWSKNPFRLTDPIQLFHLAAFIMISGGVSRMLVGEELLANALSTGALFITCGLGLWFGTWLCVLSLNRRQVESD